MKPDNVITRRPAETAGAAASVLAGAIAAIATGDALAALPALAGLVPAAVSYLYDNGGLVGIAGGLWRGRRG